MHAKGQFIMGNFKSFVTSSQEATRLFFSIFNKWCETISYQMFLINNSPIIMLPAILI